MTRVLWALLAGLVVFAAIVQAWEVSSRINQLIWYHQKFTQYDGSIEPITAGFEATFVFMLASTAILFLGGICWRHYTRHKIIVLRNLMVLCSLSMSLFLIIWLGLIVSPYVELVFR